MAWLKPFQLGRPNATVAFEINPDGLTWDDLKLGDVTRGADGTLNAVTVSRDRPTARLRGAYITPVFWNQLRALMMIDDTPLVFKPMDDTDTQRLEMWQERCVPTSLTAIPVADNSMLRGSALQVAAGGATAITLAGVWSAYNAAVGATGGGTLYPATYADATRTITPASPLPNLNPVYVSYRSTLMAVHLAKVPGSTQGGWVNVWKYDVELQGA